MTSRHGRFTQAGGTWIIVHAVAGGSDTAVGTRPGERRRSGGCRFSRSRCKGGEWVWQVDMAVLGAFVARWAHGDGSVALRACGRKPFPCVCDRLKTTVVKSNGWLAAGRRAGEGGAQAAFRGGARPPEP